MWTYNYTNELYHFGVKGMKWGVRKEYKPHPRKPAKKKDEDKESKFKFTDKQKKAIKIGATVAATALVAYGGYKLYQNREGIANNIHAFNMKRKQGKSNMDFIKNEWDSHYGGNLPLKKKSRLMSLQEDMAAVNPNYSIFDRNYNMNCANCCLALEMRQRGLDVTAKPNPIGTRISSIGEFFTGLKSESFIQMNIDADIPNNMSSTARGNKVKKVIADNISKAYEGDARGMIFVPHIQGNHWVNWIKKGDNVEFYDAQNTSVDLVHSLFANYRYKRNSVAQQLTSIRLDDLEPTDGILDMVANVGDVSKADFDAYAIKGKNFITKYVI